MPEEDELENHYDFSDAEQGKFYRPNLKMPVYLDAEIEKYFIKKAGETATNPEQLINDTLRRAIETAS